MSAHWHRLPAVLPVLLTSQAAWAQHAWTVESAAPGTTPWINAREDFLVSGFPWDADGIAACPPVGADDVQCYWSSVHLASHPGHEKNGVLGAWLDGSAAQSVVFLSDVWVDAVSSPATWWVNYDVHYVAVDPADLPSLRATLQFQESGLTKLTLFQPGSAGPQKVQHKDAPTHFWIDAPEVGSNWRLRVILQRTLPGAPAQVWLDNVNAVEADVTLFDEAFPPVPGDLNGDGCINQVDLGILLANYDCTASPGNCPGDTDGDGDTDQADLGTLLAGYGDC